MAVRAQTLEQFITKASLAHQGKFDYSKSVYTKGSEKIEVICPIHGSFFQIAAVHLQGKGCPKCANKQNSTEEIIEQIVAVHRDTYDYSLITNLKNKQEKLKIICKKHGLFEQRFVNHVKGHGCPVCKVEGYRLTQDEFLAKCFEKHGNLYDYSKSVYSVNHVKVIIGCAIHGDFLQPPDMHMSGQGCPKCSKSYKLTKEDFVAACKSVHGELYDYADSDYVRNTIKVKIGCKIHGYFLQTPQAHKGGQGCPQCRLDGLETTHEEFSARSNVIHGNKYSYVNSDYDYRGRKTYVEIVCKEHGAFWQRKDQHLIGAGCPRCSIDSKGERELYDFVNSLSPAIRSNRTIIKPLELDVYLPEHKLAFEYNGLYWHSDKFDGAKTRHKEKLDACKSVGVRLVHIYEDDWLNRRSVIEKFIRNLAGINSVKVQARKCCVVQVSSEDVKQFLDDNHIQGSCDGEINFALRHQDSIVAVMKFSKNTSNRGKATEGCYELVRYATSCSVVGGASRLFVAFLKAYQPTEVRSFSDDGMFTGDMYKILGFAEDGKVPPDYKVIVGGKRYHKAGFKRSELARKYGSKFDETLTANENYKNLGLYLIYNSGMTRWVYKPIDNTLKD